MSVYRLVVEHLQRAMNDYLGTDDVFVTNVTIQQAFSEKCKFCGRKLSGSVITFDYFTIGGDCGNQRQVCLDQVDCSKWVGGCWCQQEHQRVIDEHKVEVEAVIPDWFGPDVFHLKDCLSCSLRNVCLDKQRFQLSVFCPDWVQIRK